MLQLKENQKVTVWEPRETEKIKNTIEANISSAKKDREDAWKYYSWNAKFVGNAYEKAHHLKLGNQDRIELKEAAIENYYNKDKQKLYVTVVIFDFEKIEKVEKKE